MNSSSLNVSASRSWRDIPQPVKPRAMSRGGRWRLAMALLRAAAAIVLTGALAWGAWQLFGALGQNPQVMPDAAKAVPIRVTELRTSPGGVLDETWLARTLALPRNASLMEVDLEALRARILADGQVLTASLTRNFPDRLTVHITERTPIARLKVDVGGRPERFLVARDGMVYGGSNYDPQMVETLPWLGGFTLRAEGNGFQPIAGMEVVADLLARAQFEAEHLYRDWLVVSLERLAADQELLVTTRSGANVVFTTRTDFFLQLAKLDYMTEKLANLPVVRIDLSLGREVPVKLDPILSGAPGGRPALAPGFNALPLSRNPREL